VFGAPAALAPTTVVTRRPEGVPDAVHDEAARPFEERPGS